MKFEFISLLLLANLSGLISFGQKKADDIIGVWLTGGDEPAKIQISRIGEKFYGKIIWLKNATENGGPRLDRNNPDKAKKNQPVVGLEILKGFVFDGDDEWESGEIYDPESGKTYRCYMTINSSGKLKVRGYIGISLFGRTEIWTRTN